jgi:hypothetical protein
MALAMTGKLGGHIAPTQKLRVAAQKMKTSDAIKPKKATTTTQRNASVLGAVAGGRSSGAAPKKASTGKISGRAGVSGGGKL